MYLHIPLLLVLCAQTIPVSAANPYTYPGSHALKRFHNAALKHSAGLARDLRVAFNGILAPPPHEQKAIQKRDMFCEATNGQVPFAVNSSSPSTSSISSTSAKTSGSAQPTSAIPTSAGGSSTSTPSSSASGAAPTSTSAWKLAESHQGANFFTGWSFFTGADPTAGVVTYIDQPTAQSANLVEVNSAGNAVMRVETTPQVSSTRQSIRITTQSTWNQGLFLMDSVHIPTGCATWPAFWTNGPNWPAGGEIDIVEGINNYTNNQATIHTNPGCTLASASADVLGITGTVVGGTNCAAAESGNQGCGMRSPQGNSFGAPFNANGGGVYAMLWDGAGISIFFFARGSVPADIDTGAPDPTGWGAPMANWPADNCNPSTFFYDHSAIFDTTLCGDWAGSGWTTTGLPGQSTSCAAETGYPTCEAFVAAEGAAFSEAYWEVASVKIYQSQ
ncbi:glycoside hydrolase family 16 protein [Athelia psychrophila]|uniref:Glycoside hydrolase family 16 protein n=1 Tax=Athelia psychrophila TaxID=1759441 RepID=A0A166V866_9AGAM|nr:glycoside hydrolase family 16 protein [Fibularhizoctonia sp. CBS 109695]